MRQSAVCALRRAGCVGGEGVEAVFEHVEVERAEVGVHELVERVIGAVELEVVVGVADLRGEFGGAGEDVLVERFQLRKIVLTAFVAGSKSCRLPSRKRKVLRSLR